MSTDARILGWLAPYRGESRWPSCLTALACLLNLPVPLLVQGLVDRVVAGGRWSALPAVRWACSPSSPPRRGSALANGLVIGRVGLGVVRDLRHRLYDRLQRLGLAYYDRTPDRRDHLAADGRRRRRSRRSSPARRSRS